MAKKIVILNGSPRPSGNTAALIEAFTKGAEQAGNGVVRFDVCKMNIHPCLGCCGGGKNPESPCVQKDDMDAIYPHYKDADLVVLASPMYYWSLSGQLKCAFDRLFAVAELSPSYANPVKDCVLLMAAEGDTESNFEPVPVKIQAGQVFAVEYLMSDGSTEWKYYISDGTVQNGQLITKRMKME